MAKLLIISPAEIPLQPDIEADEEIATPHLLNPELSDPVAAVAPSDGDRGEGVAAYDGLQGKLNGKIEMRGEEGAAPLNDLPAVGLEGIGGVIETMLKEDADEGIGHAVEDILHGWVVNSPPATHKSAAEDAVVPLVQLLPVTDDISAVIGLVSHHDDDSITPHLIESLDDGAAETMESDVLDGLEFRHLRRFLLEQLPSSVRGSVIDHDDLMGNSTE